MSKPLRLLSFPFTFAALAVAQEKPPIEAPAPLEAGATAAQEPVLLEPLTVFSSRVALQEPTATYAAPVSALRYEPQVDVQARNFAEGQADVTIRGGTFENTGFSVGSLPIYDPQTGHYSAELPISPYLLGAPEIRTGAAQAAGGFNATAGGVDYGWRRIRAGGAVSAGGGGDDLARGEVYAGLLSKEKIAGLSVGVDVSVASSEGDGTLTGADHDFDRYNGRVQLVGERSQTDFFAGYQAKNFAWPNLYAAGGPGGPLRDERERLQTKLFVANHRSELGTEGDYVQAGAYYRGHRDHYSIPVFNFNARHQTVVRGAALEGRHTVFGRTAARYTAGLIEDDLDSSSLRFGRFSNRTQHYASLAAEQGYDLDERRELVLVAGLRHDDSNRDESELSPLASVEFRQVGSALRRVYVSYTETTQLPTYQALNASPAGLFGGDPDLGRATAASYEVGAEIGAGAWTVAPAVFYRRDDSLLDYVFDPTKAVSARVATAVDLDTVGVEIFARREWTRFDLLLGYTFLDKADDYTRPDLASFYALNYAEHRLTLGCIARLGGGWELRIDNELRRQADNALRQEGRDNIDTALGLSWRVPGLAGLTLNAQVENAWDTSFEDVPLVPGPRRSWSVGGSYVW